MKRKLTHFDAAGKARMVDVGEKPITRRLASAVAVVKMKSATMQAIRGNTLKKGDALATARIAGIQAAKRCGELIPLCHPLPLESVEVDFEMKGAELKITATAKITGRTGVEMEALLAVTVAALTIYDMCKSIDRGISIRNVHLAAKSGGRSGDWRA